ncbi:hypothetical protein SUGI_0367150 [Cryptomeria japonica]|nr:hypothetical protein SUGI_0367150 [Cryptomeria japonica]
MPEMGAVHSPMPENSKTGLLEFASGDWQGVEVKRDSWPKSSDFFATCVSVTWCRTSFRIPKSLSTIVVHLSTIPIPSSHNVE